MVARKLLFKIWRQIPPSTRQWFAHKLLDSARPSLNQVSFDQFREPDIPRIVVGFLTSPSGLGQSARLTANALSNQGYQVYGIDLSRYFYEVSDLIPNTLRDGKKLYGNAHVIININAPYLPYVIYLLGRQFLQNKFVTGYWAWELPKLPKSWNRGFSCVHNVAVPSSFVAQAVFKSGYKGDITVAPHPVATDLPPLSPHITGARKRLQPFTIISVLNIGSGYERKNPVALINAFRLAFANQTDCCLRMLVSNSSQHPSARTAIEKAANGLKNVQITWQELDRKALWKWWGTPDAYASLHKSEGFGLPLAEAMCSGYPVIATGWSGNMDFMTQENSFPVDYTLIDVIDPQAKYSGECGKWADASVVHAAQIFRNLKNNSALVKAVSVNARNTTLATVSVNQFCSRLLTSPLGGRASDLKSSSLIQQ